MTFLTFVAPLAAKGLVRGDMENALDSCVVGNISANSLRLHAPALLLLVLPRKSNMFPDLSPSGQYLDINFRSCDCLVVLNAFYYCVQINPIQKKKSNQFHKKKLDGVGPVDNRPATDKLQHFVQKKNATCDM